MIQNEIIVKLFKGRKRCFYCGKGWIVLRWTPVMETPFSPSRWVCLHHTIRHLKEA